MRLLAKHDPAGQRRRAAHVPQPVTDPLRLELLTGSGDAPSSPRPVALGAVIEACANPVLAVQQASRWASYAARVAVTPLAGLNDRALLEAQLRGVWVVTVDAFRTFRGGRRRGADGHAPGIGAGARAPAAGRAGLGGAAPA